MTKDPYQIVKHQYVTEKAVTLQELKNAESNPSLKRFKLPKYVFVVDCDANKKEIAVAIEEIYKDKNVKVVSVNTLNVKPKVKSVRGKMRGRFGTKAGFKKAIVTLEEKDSLDEV